MFDHKRHARNQQIDALVKDVFDPMAEVLPKGQQGVAQIDHFTMTAGDVLASISDHGEDFVDLGTYARLKVNGVLMMTDSPMEKRTNLEVVRKAQGRVLIAGLGLGMILRTILRKPEVTRVTVLEKYQDVVDLVLPSLAGDHLISGFEENGHNHLTVAGTKLEVIVADVFEWEAHPDTPKYNVIYFDIWPNSRIVHLPEMEALYKRYRPLLAKGGWMDSWTYKLLKEKKASDARLLRDLPVMLEKQWKRHTPEEFAAKLRVLLNDQIAATVLDEPEKQVIRRFAAAKGIALHP